MGYRIFSFPLFAIARSTSTESQFAMLNMGDCLALVIFTTREASNEFRRDNPGAEIVEIIDESHAETMLNDLPDADAVILDPEAGRGFVMQKVDFLKSILPQSHELN